MTCSKTANPTSEELISEICLNKQKDYENFDSEALDEYQSNSYEL
jgi:hypothetical protein